MKSDVKRLLAEATPLPWTYRAVADAYLYGDGDFPPSPVNLDLAVYAVNHLPDYLAAVEALERFVESHEAGYPASIVMAYEACDAARAALARLRDEVPA